MTFSKNIDDVDVIVTIESESDGKASADISIDGETGRKIDATILFDDNKLQTVDTLPYNNVFKWENLGSSTHTIEIEWLGLDGDSISLPFMFAGSQSVHLGH